MLTLDFFCLCVDIRRHISNCHRANTNATRTTNAPPQEAHESKRLALEEDFNRREHRLKEACRRQADALRLEHKVPITAVEASVRSDRREFASTLSQAADLPSPVEPQENRGGEGYRPGRIEEGGQIRYRKSPCVEQTTAHPARSKEMVELRGELTRHLAAVLNADGARHLQDATRVMGLMGELEAKARLESEVRHVSRLCCSAEVLLSAFRSFTRNGPIVRDIRRCCGVCRNKSRSGGTKLSLQVQQRRGCVEVPEVTAK